MEAGPDCDTGVPLRLFFQRLHLLLEPRQERIVLKELLRDEIDLSAISQARLPREAAAYHFVVRGQELHGLNLGRLCLRRLLLVLNSCRIHFGRQLERI